MPKAFIFDVFGTVVDWRTGVSNEAAKWFAMKDISFDPDEFADLWRGKYQPAMERIRSGNRGYVVLDILHRENLEQLLSQVGIKEKFSEEEILEFNRAWEKLPPWPDSVEGLTALKERAIIAPCSNGSISLTTRMAKHAGLPWDCILGSEVAQNYKPHADAYLKSVAALQLQPSNVVMVAAHNDDLKFARKAGLKTAYIPRPREFGGETHPDLEPSDDWDYVVSKIGELATLDV